MDRKVYGFMRV